MWSHGAGSLMQEFITCTCFDDGVLILPSISLIEGCTHETGFLLPMLPLGWNFLLLTSRSWRTVSYCFYIHWCWMILLVCVSFFECIFTNTLTYITKRITNPEIGKKSVKTHSKKDTQTVKDYSVSIDINTIPSYPSRTGN